ncbi:hypothetical protein Tco_0411878 [Tanacetum coccineum]
MGCLSRGLKESQKEEILWSKGAIVVQDKVHGLKEDLVMVFGQGNMLRKDHPSIATGTGWKTFAGLRQLMPISPLVLRPSFQADIQAHVVVQSACSADVPVYTAAATVTSA